MKKIINTNIALLSFLFVVFALSFTSCKKDSDGSPVVKPGTPVLESVTPASAQGGALVTVKGTGLGDIVSIVFEKESVPTSINPNLNTETVIMFRVPGDAAGGNQNIILTNSAGKSLSVPFNVLAYPQLNSVSNYDYVAGSTITITGNNLNDVSSVKLTGTSDACSIVTKTKKQLVITMPNTTAFRNTLDVTNVTGLTTSTFEMVNLTNAFICYDDAWGPGAYNSGVQNWGWGCTVSETSDISMTGTKCLKVAYTDGGLSLFLGSDWADPMHVFTDWYTPAYFTFWARGDAKDASVTVKTDSPPWDGTYSGSGQITVTVKADVWTYFKIPASTFSGKYGRLNLTCSEPKTVYFDDLLYCK